MRGLSALQCAEIVLRPEAGMRQQLFAVAAITFEGFASG
jgi:hypothetical protein